LKADVQGDFKDTNALGNVTILGVTSTPTQVKLNDEAIDSSKFAYNATASTLKLSGLNDLTRAGAWQGSWTLSWA
jgi:alpha-glucosidase